MIGYVTLGVNDSEKSKKFYDAVLGEVGGKRTWANDRLQGYGGGGGPSIAIGTPYDGQKATVGNGTMISLAAPDQDTVKRVHAKAMSAGGKDEGVPGFRPAEATKGFYGAYFRDPDGNKLCVFSMVKG